MNTNVGPSPSQTCTEIQNRTTQLSVAVHPGQSCHANLFGSVTNLCLRSCFLSLLSDLKKACRHVGLILEKFFPDFPDFPESPGLDRRGLLEMFFQLFDPHAEEHQEDTFCFPHPVALCELTVWLIIYHTVYLESLETPGQPEPDHGAVPLLCSGNQFQCTDGKNWETLQESLRPSCLCADWPTCEQRHFYWWPQNSCLYLNWKNTDVLKADRRSVTV